MRIELRGGRLCTLPLSLHFCWLLHDLPQVELRGALVHSTFEPAFLLAAP